MTESENQLREAKQHMKRKLKLSAAIVITAILGISFVQSPASAEEYPGVESGGLHYLSDVAWSSATTGYGELMRDYRNLGQSDKNRYPITVGGQVFTKGVGVHATSRIELELSAPGDCTQFLSYVGIDDSAGPTGSRFGRFIVKADGDVATTVERKAGEVAGLVDVDISGASHLELIVEEGNDNGNSFADWAEATINCSGDTVAFPLRINAQEGTELSELVPGAAAGIYVNDANPGTQLTLFLGEELLTTAIAADDGRTLIQFVVPPQFEPGENTLRVEGISLGGVTTNGSAEVSIVEVSARDYYVDCSAYGEGDGSISAPFASLEQLNSVRNFGAGSHIYFRAGSTCDGQLRPRGSGTSENPNVIGVYGNGDAPVIDGVGEPSAVYLQDISYWTVQGLHIRNTSTDRTVGRQGITAQILGSVDQSGIVISNNLIEDVAGWSDKTNNDPRYGLSAGIMIKVDRGTGAYQGVMILDNEITNTGGGGIKIAGDTDHYHTDVHIAHNYIHEVGGDGIVVHNTDAVLVEYNRAINLGQGDYPFVAGNFAGMWPYNSMDPVFQYNVVGNSVTSTYDSTAWDCDISVVGTCLFQHNYSYGNAGGFYLDCVSGCNASSTQTKSILRYNIVQDDCRLAGASGGPGTTWVYNNVFYCPTKDFLDVMTGPREFFNNIVIARYGRFNTQDVSYSNNAYYGGVEAPPGDRNAILDEDPLLANPGTAQQDFSFPGYQLLEGSPLIGAGIDLDSYAGEDIFGNQVLSGANIGAYAGGGVISESLAWDSARNITSIVHDSNRMTGAVEIVDGSGRFAYSAEALAQAGLRSGENVWVKGMRFTWDAGDEGTPDSVKAVGQDIALNDRGEELVFVGFSVGENTGGLAQVTYTDGTYDLVDMRLPSWTESEDEYIDSEAIAHAYFQNQHTQHWLGGISTLKKPAKANYVHVGTVTVDSSKTIERVRLPEGNPIAGSGLTLFALGVV